MERNNAVVIAAVLAAACASSAAADGTHFSYAQAAHIVGVSADEPAIPVADPVPAAASAPDCTASAPAAPRPADACAKIALWKAANESHSKLPDGLVARLNQEVTALRAAYGDLDALKCRELSPDQLDAAIGRVLDEGAAPRAIKCSAAPAPAASSVPAVPATPTSHGTWSFPVP